jgi:hypothetical protein
MYAQQPQNKARVASVMPRLTFSGPQLDGEFGFVDMVLDFFIRKSVDDLKPWTTCPLTKRQNNKRNRKTQKQNNNLTTLTTTQLDKQQTTTSNKTTTYQQQQQQLTTQQSTNYFNCFLFNYATSQFPISNFQLPTSKPRVPNTQLQ